MALTMAPRLTLSSRFVQTRLMQYMNGAAAAAADDCNDLAERICAATPASLHPVNFAEYLLFRDSLGTRIVPSGRGGGGAQLESIQVGLEGDLLDGDREAEAIRRFVRHHYRRKQRLHLRRLNKHRI
jgi:hypothetical protein